MATRIRLKRLGRRNSPFYRIIVIDSRIRRDGAAIEEVGWYDPILKKDNLTTTKQLNGTAEIIDVPIHGRFIIAGNDVYSFAEHGLI